MKNLMVICFGIVISVALAEGPRCSSMKHLRSDSQLLEPLIPFVEAVEKAKNGTPQGFYALAIHYAKGEEIEHDSDKARYFLQKACEANYGNAVFVSAMLAEYDCQSETGRSFRSSYDMNVDLCGYTGINDRQWAPSLQKSFINALDVATVRAGYEHAINLGVSVATNELARFERRMENVLKEVAQAVAADRQKKNNAILVESELGIPCTTKKKIERGEFLNDAKKVKTPPQKKKDLPPDFKKDSKLVKAPPMKQTGKATAADKPMTETEYRKFLEQGYEVGAKNQLAPNEESRCVSLVAAALKRYWVEDFHWTEDMQSVYLEITFGPGGLLRSCRIVRSSGDAQVDRSVLAAAKATGSVPGLSPDFVRKYSGTPFVLEIKR